VIGIAIEMRLTIQSSGFEYRTVAFRPPRQQFYQVSLRILSEMICDSVLTPADFQL
jgi:hypothetical protein